MNSTICIRWLFAIGLSLLMGCITPQPSKIAVVASPENKQSQPKMATVYFYNDSGPTLLGATLDMADETGVIVSLSRHTYAVRALPAGPHTLNLGQQTMGFSGRKLTIEFKPGETYNIVAAYDPLKSHLFPFAGDPFSIRAVDSETARRMRDTMTAVP
jgi:hypothetical protein